MLNAKLEKQINNYEDQLMKYYNLIKRANNNTVSNLEKKYEEVNVKFKETQKIIESDGKHEIRFNDNMQMYIKVI